MSDWSNGLQLPDEKTESEKPMPLHEEKQPSPEARHEHPHEVRHERTLHSDKRKTGKSKSTFAGISQAQVGIGVAAVLVISLTAVLAYRSTDATRKLAEQAELSQQNKRSLEPGVWVAENFVATFKVVAPWEQVLSETDMWVASYKEDGITAQLEVGIQQVGELGDSTESTAAFAGITGPYTQVNQLTFDGGAEVKRVTATLEVTHKDAVIRSQCTIQGSEDVLTDEKIATITSQVKQLLSDATLE